MYLPEYVITTAAATTNATSKQPTIIPTIQHRNLVECFVNVGYWSCDFSSSISVNVCNSTIVSFSILWLQLLLLQLSGLSVKDSSLTDEELSIVWLLFVSCPSWNQKYKKLNYNSWHTLLCETPLKWTCYNHEFSHLNTLIMSFRMPKANATILPFTPIHTPKK